MHTEWQHGEYVISTNPQRLDLTLIHGFLRQSYWAQNIPLETVQRSIEHSLCFGLYAGDAAPRQQVGFARVITDRATFAYLADVFVVEAYRGRGLSKWLMEVIMGHPELQGLRRWHLATRDAHELYRKFGFTELSQPSIFMERHAPNAYIEVQDEHD